MPIARSIVATLALLLATPSFAQRGFEVESTPCCEAQRAQVTAQPETATLAALSDRALRDAGVLWLKLENGRSLKMIDCPVYSCGDSPLFHRLEAWWPEQRYYVVRVGHYEEESAYLVSEKDGRVSEVFTVPILSPSGRHAIANSTGGYGRGLQLIWFDTTPPSVRELPRPNCPDRRPGDGIRPTPVWIDNEHVKFEGTSFPPSGNTNAKEMLRIVDGKAEWEC